MMSQDNDRHIYEYDNQVPFQRRSAPNETYPKTSGQAAKATSNCNDEDIIKIKGRVKVIFSLMAVFFVLILVLFGVLIYWGARSNIQDNGVTSSLNQSVYDLINIVTDNKRGIDLLRRGARYCSELRDNHGVSTAGYYMMRGNYYTEDQASYIYCNFNQYAGVSTCTQLTSNYNITTYGYYLLGKSTTFQYCPDVYTCHHLVHRDGITESGFYQVGTPDDQYWVYCNLFSGIATTEIWHDSMAEKEATGCEPRGCYSLRPQYSISLDKIVMTMNNSRECQQFIKFRCLGAVLLAYRYGYWLSRGGEKMEYWGGASSKRPGYCACGEVGLCDDRSKTCNCDKNAAPMTFDEGYLTDKSELPVSEMRFGDMVSESEQGWHTLGKLECFGSV